MKKRVLRSCTMLLLSFAATQAIASAEETHGIEGVWSVNVAIRDCQTGALIRAVRAMNLFMHDGSLTETAVNIMRTSSLGTWRHDQRQTYTAIFRFFRYNPDGTFASIAKVTRTIDLNHNNTQFTSTGTVEDFDANNVLISNTCSTETATRPQ